MISVSVEQGDEVILGEPTDTPNSTVTLTAPAHTAAVSLPFDIEWTVQPGTHAATHVFVFVGADNGEDAYPTVLPIDGASTNSVGYVKSTDLSYSHAITIQ